MGLSNACTLLVHSAVNAVSNGREPTTIPYHRTLGDSIRHQLIVRKQHFISLLDLTPTTFCCLLTDDFSACIQHYFEVYGTDWQNGSAATQNYKSSL